MTLQLDIARCNGQISDVNDFQVEEIVAKMASIF